MADVNIGDVVEFANSATKDERVRGTVDWVFPVNGTHHTYIGEYDVVTEDNMFRVHAGDLLSVNGEEIL